MRRKILRYNPRLKELARKLRKNMTLAEILLWNELKQKRFSDLILIVNDLSMSTSLISTVKN